jgi:hypothetical protein
MLQSISSPRAEGASPPSPRCSDAKKRSYTRNPAVTSTILQLQIGSFSYTRSPKPSSEECKSCTYQQASKPSSEECKSCTYQQASKPCICRDQLQLTRSSCLPEYCWRLPLLSDGLIRGGHGQYSNGWGRRVTQFSCLGFLGSILHSSFEGAGRAKCKAGLSKMRLAHFDGSGRLPPRGPFRSALNAGVHATENGFDVKLAFPSGPCVRAHPKPIALV